MEYIITHHPEKRRFETTVDGITAYIEYECDDRRIEITHTIVPPPVEGRGIASALVKHVYDYARNHHVPVLPTCSYAAVWLKRHPEYGE